MKDKKIEEFWELRSKEYGTQKEGVLPKSFPSVMNNYLHNWMVRNIAKEIKRKDKIVLDIGCGYGRVSKELVKKFPNIYVKGVDISAHYIELYNKNLSPRGKGVKGDMRNLPFRDKTFDVVFCITSLMYLLAEKDQLKALSEMKRVLKDDGTLILIERNPWGHKFITLWGLVPRIRGEKNKEIISTDFTPGNMKGLIKKSRFTLKRARGIPKFTISFYKIYIVSRVLPPLGKFVLVLVRLVDTILSFMLTPSLYVVYILKKNK